MEGSLCHEFETDLPAADMWEIYGSLPHVLSKVELVEGDGGVGTVLLVTFPPAPGTSESATHTEKFIKIDNENYVKEAEVGEGGSLNFGFLKYIVRFEIIEKDNGTSIIRSTIENAVDEKHASNASLVSTSVFVDIADATTRYIKERKSTLG